MKKTLIALVLTAGLLFSLTPALAYTTVSFYKITNNSENLAGQLFVDVYLTGENAPNPAGGTVAIGTDQVGFYFRNTGPTASEVQQIYFDDGMLQAAAPTIYDNPESVDFTTGATPADLPGGNSISPAFDATLVFNTSADNPPPPGQGINPNEALLLTFGTTGDVIAALTDGSLRIGLHVQSIGTLGKSDSYVNNPVPLPGALLLLGAGLARLAAYARRRRNEV